MKLPSDWLLVTTLFLVGLFLGGFPEVASLILVFLGAYMVIRTPLLLREFVPIGALLIACYGIPVLFWSSRASDLWQIPLGLLLFAGAKGLRVTSWFTIGLRLGLVIAVGYALVGALALLPRLEWVVTPDLATMTRRDEVIRFVPVNTSNAWVFQQLEYQGGDFEVRVEVRAEKPILVNTFILHQGLPGGSINVPCQVGSSWSECRLRIKTTSFLPAIFGLGSASTWKAGDTPLEVRNSRVTVIVPPPLLERLTAITRVQGAAFNANAFGAWLAVAGLIVVALSGRWWMFGLNSVVPLIGIVLTGSRNALLAFMGGLVVLLVARSRAVRALPALLVVATLLVSWQLWSVTRGVPPVTSPVQNPGQPQFVGTRALEVLDSGGIRLRLEVFRLAMKVFLSSPWVGVRDMQQVLENSIDVRATRAGLVPANLAHAHNLWLQMAGERGILGLLGMGALWGLIALRAWKRADAIAIAVLSMLLVLNSVDYFFHYAPVQIAFWMCAAGFPSLRNAPPPTPASGHETLQSGKLQA
jgi:O-Antigen ligase